MKSSEFPECFGDGAGDEEFIPGNLPGSTKGSTWVDFTARRADGSAVRIQTVDTLADGVTPTAMERAAADRIRAAFPDDKLILNTEDETMRQIHFFLDPIRYQACAASL